MESNRHGPDDGAHGQAQVSAGRLKIFFGYAPGVGKTYAMLKAAHDAKRRGIDVVVGYITPRSQPETALLANGLETLPAKPIQAGSVTLSEFDLDAAIKRRPQLILLDDLAHANAIGSRHAKRYQDVKELLMAGIDVYTTVDVRHIESLNDTIAAVTGITVEERIPDSLFDGASQIELIDLEPAELLDRLQAGKLDNGIPAEENIFTAEKLTALREIALRRCADRMNLINETARLKIHGDYNTDEHILVCLSPAPSNQKIIRTAARMAKAFHGNFTALFVETPDFPKLSDENRKRLRENIHLAEQLGAKIETVYGDNIAYQIAEFARLSGVSKIVLGRSNAVRRSLFQKPGLTEQLIANAPNIDIHIIPDHSETTLYRAKRESLSNDIVLSLKDLFKSVAILLAATVIGYIFFGLGFTEVNIITVYILAVLLISIITTHRVYALVASIVSVLVFNFFFTMPHFTFMAYDQGYPVTFLIMFTAAFLTGSLAIRLKTHAKQAAQAAFRTKVLFDTNQVLQKAEGRDNIITATANQLIQLLGRTIIVYPAQNGALQSAQIFRAAQASADESPAPENERAVADWVYQNNKRAGASTDTFSNASCLYLAIRLNQNVYGVVGIAVGETPLDSFENSVLLSILGECALALENEKNAREKEEAAILAKNEQLRANLLRAISHDLRTPLTSISGNADNLLSNGNHFDEATKNQIYTDIYEDSIWLTNLVENLLSVTRIEDGRMKLNMTTELIDEIISEALRHIGRRSAEHRVSVQIADGFLLAKVDARLIVQVIINIVDNAIKYTPKESEIRINACKDQGMILITIADNGPGISDETKKHVFDMFYSGANKIADSRRSLGLGLSLCKSIVTAHGGEISVADNQPHGTIFRFTLPAEEVTLHE